MRLYHHPISSSARRAVMTALHLGVAFEPVIVNLMDPDHRRMLEALNPNSKVPVLVDGDFVLWESCAIMQYLCAVTPGQTLYPDEPRARADVDRWLHWSSQHWMPAMGVLNWERNIKPMIGAGDADPIEDARGVALLSCLTPTLDAQLAGRRWVCGDTLTLADFALAVPLMYIDAAQLPVRDSPNLMAWFERVQQLDAWQRTVPEPMRQAA